ncbi:MAG: GTP cyclohydrolase I FolE2 [Rhodobacteraceae bacterium]|nr:GTP cyclohydrolase I FolE2 [Paracoccaceae bacterium]
MNVHDPAIETKVKHNSVEETLTELEAQEALNTLRRWASQQDATAFPNVGPDEAAAFLGKGLNDGYPLLSRHYQDDFKVDATYIGNLPDLQNGPSSLIRGSKTAIQHVGISNFRLPLRYRTRDNGDLRLETSVTGTVSLEAEKKGINMSRIMRSFYKHADETFSFEVIDAALSDYITSLESFDARIQMRLSFPVKRQSLRSGLEGYQYYDIALESGRKNGQKTKIMHLDYVYSSTCPCSLELSEHARQTRGQLATPHSQRSVARISVEVLDGEVLWFEDLIDHCTRAVPTETQVMVKREDEQAFAELNAANPIFVEDAARLFCEQLEGDARIGDFRVVASHQESLHSHDAISVLTRGPLFDAESLDPRLFETLIKRG